MDSVEGWLAPLPDLIQSAAKMDGKQVRSTVFVDAVPMGKGRPRFTRQGRCYTPQATRQAENLVQLAGKQYVSELLSGQIGVLVLAVFPVPSSWSKKKRLEALAGRIRPAVKPDFDNVAKLYCDALNGIVWEDDKQIVDGRCIKVYGQQPGVLVLSWPL